MIRARRMPWTAPWPSSRTLASVVARHLARRAVIRLCLSVAGGLFSLNARAQIDPDSARRAVERGEALPLSVILARVRPDLGGEVVDVAFNRRRGRWIYDIRVVAASGRLAEVYVDAATAQIVGRDDD